MLGRSLLSTLRPGARAGWVRGLAELVTTRLGYSQYGDPSSVVSLHQEKLSCQLQPGEVLARYILSPVNPADVNVLQGSYPIRPSLPATGGGEGVAEILSVGGEVRDLSPGDWVLPARPMSGTWRTHLVCHHADWIRIRNDIPALGAATMLINPCTAYRMLRDFVSLEAGDWIIQNGANSAVGQAVIQLARLQGVKTVNVVRDREDIAALKSRLAVLGADMVLTEEELRSASKMFRSGEMRRPRLALNCVGGQSSTELCKVLGEAGVMVTYGGMSRKPVMAATSHLIFQDIRLAGFWMGQWYERQGRSEARLEMYRDITDMISAGNLQPPQCELVPLEDFKLVLDNTLRGFLPAKYVFQL